MKKLLILCLIAGSAFAVDYNAMSLEELQSLKGTVPTEERAAFQAAMREKVQGGTTEGVGKNRFNEDRGQGTTQRLRDGSGMGGMYKGSRSGGFGGGGHGGGGGKGR